MWCKCRPNVGRCVVLVVHVPGMLILGLTVFKDGGKGGEAIMSDHSIVLEHIGLAFPRHRVRSRVRRSLDATTHGERCHHRTVCCAQGREYQSEKGWKF